jgi:hypothetical protein
MPRGGRTVTVLADQNFPAVLPSSENRCLSIICLDQGGLDELIDLFLKIARQITVLAGTVVLFGSLISLSKVGLQSYAAACVNSKRRLTGGVKGIEAVPFVPPPLGGCNDPELIRNIVDTCVWLGSIPGFPLSGTTKVLVDLVMEDGEGGRDVQLTLTALSSCRSISKVMTVPTSLALAGQVSRPSCQPGLRLTKKNI